MKSGLRRVAPKSSPVCPGCLFTGHLHSGRTALQNCLALTCQLNVVEEKCPLGQKSCRPQERYVHHRVGENLESKARIPRSTPAPCWDQQNSNNSQKIEKQQHRGSKVLGETEVDLRRRVHRRRVFDPVAEFTLSQLWRAKSSWRSFFEHG